MFEECFSTIELGFATPMQTPARAVHWSDEDMDALQAILVETLEQALNSLEDDLPVLH